MGGTATITVIDEDTGEEIIIDPTGKLSRRQISAMITTPEMFVQYAHHLREKAIEAGIKKSKSDCRCKM